MTSSGFQGCQQAELSREQMCKCQEGPFFKNILLIEPIKWNFDTFKCHFTFLKKINKD